MKLLLDQLVSDQKLVLTVDYTTDMDLIIFARNSAKTKGYLHYVGVVELDELVDQEQLFEGNEATPDAFIPLYVGSLSFLMLIAIILRRKSLIRIT